MKIPHQLSPDALLSLLGLQTKSTAQMKVLQSLSLVMGGAVIGAAVALLVTPKSGKQLRGDLREGVQGLGTRANKFLHKSKGSAAVSMNGAISDHV
ncbi:MAG: YtxH domain-containing protein [Deltaproteobacteria bacterium]|nr:YtxH domain-containing protein [Deltaproteobacteria bacterium]